MTTLLLLGFFIGMRHAMEADHVAAVASLSTRSGFLGQAVKQGTVWGIGHTITLFAVGTIVLLIDTVVPERLALGLEFAVGIMLVILGIDVIHRLIKDHIHFHIHRHAGGTTHFHAHSHLGEQGHDPDRHEHEHVQRFPIRALLVGMMHGLAGSAALILLTLEHVQSLMMGILYIALFGFGSIAGMAVLSIIIAIPLHHSAKGLTWLHNGLQGVIGSATILLGGMLIYEIGVTQRFLFGYM